MIRCHKAPNPLPFPRSGEGSIYKRGPISTDSADILIFIIKLLFAALATYSGNHAPAPDGEGDRGKGLLLWFLSMASP